MNRVNIIFISIALLFATGAFSKSSYRSSSSSRSSYSSSKSTSSWSSKPKTTYSKPKSSLTTTKKKTSSWGATSKKTTIAKPVTTVKKDQSSTLKKTTSTTSTKPKAVATTAMDKKLAKKYSASDKIAAQKYKSKSEATAAYQQKMASSNKYTTSTPPPTRPEYIPQSVTTGGRSVNVVYHTLPSGGYGYGYYDPVTSAFVGLTASHMIMDAHRMRAAGYGHWDDHGRPVVYRETRVVHSDGSGSGVVTFIIILIILAITGGVLYAVFRNK